MSTSTSWQRCQGQILAPEQQVLRAAGFLDGALVVAILEADPEEPTVVSITVAVDEQSRVAVLDESLAGVIAGPPLAELVEALATECRGRAQFGDLIATCEEREDDPFEPHLEIASVTERAVVLTPATGEALEDLATDAGTTLDALALPNRSAALVEDVATIDELGLRGARLPAIVLERRTVRAALTVLGETEGQHVWGLERATIPDGRVAESFADELLGQGALLEAVSRTWPGVDRARLRAALGGDVNFEEVLAALETGAAAGALARFLEGDVAAADVEGVEQIAPVPIAELVRRRAHVAAEDARRAAQQAREDARRRAQQAAEDARTGMTAFAEAAEEPVRTWAPYVAAAVDVAVGTLIWRRAARPGTRPGWATTGKVTAGILWGGAAANVVAAVWPRVRGAR
ncbi:hypothetical protein LQF12_02650 [Ruania suaedae]|uniref:hypothetical protein n=1 Tax=Ruania suaedae TaxID=2897774 RepID=UPI001E3EFFAC|nr:hypothetical protein [Ruania suaedae]UFU03529.1 hypothetical protein LQF12_02650 [Ruania suaedae]